MNAISNFTFQESHNVRVQQINGEAWFCLPDVCFVLDIQNSRQVLQKQLDAKGVSKRYILTNGGNQELTFVNEPNLYRVIFRSNKSQAKQFQDWVFNDVLPTIRKTGKYETPSVKEEDYLTNKDMDVLQKLVWRCCDYVQVKDRPFEKFSYAIWECLRQVTGVKSPDKFEAKHLPIIAKEMHRILGVLEMYLVRANRTEARIIKLMLRQRINTDSIIDECMKELTFTEEQIHKELLHIESLPLSYECRELIRLN